MTSRVLAVLAGASLVCALPVAAQRAGTIEVGGFARYVDFDNTLPMGDDMDIGGGGGGFPPPPPTPPMGPARAPRSSVPSPPPHLRARANQRSSPPPAALCA